MLKNTLRRPLWTLLAALMLIALIPGLLMLRGGRPSTAHASGGGSASISLSTSIVVPNETVSIAGKGFGSQDYLTLQLDSPSNTPIAYFVADTSGNFSAKVTMPRAGVLQGLHLLIVTGFPSGATVETPITFVPRLFPTSGKPGMPVQLTGAAFAANETVQVYFGTTSGQLLGTTTTNATGDLSFLYNVPANLGQGTYTLTFVRTGQKPKILTSQLLVIPPTIVANPGISDGQFITATLTGFLSQETVTVSWNAEGGQVLNVVQVNTKGTANTTLYPPELVPAGTYTLTALGGTSKLQATTTINVGPGILLSNGSYGNPGSTISVLGGGFSPGETVNVYFQTQANGVVSTTVDPTGAFTVTLQVPQTYNPTASYFVYAVNTAATEQAATPFIFEPPTLSAGSNYYYYNQPVDFYGYGFISNETVNLLWNYGQPGQSQIATVTADSYGSFSTVLTPPNTPYQSSISIAAVGVTSHLTASNSLTEYPAISLTPSMGKAGITVQVSGGNFGSSETATVWFQGVAVASVTTNADGSFTTTFKLPAASGPGNQPVNVVGSTSGASAITTFAYTPKLKISPTSGPSGAVITVTGQTFSAFTSVTIFWEDLTSPKKPIYINLGTFSTDSKGAFSGTVTAPSNLTSGQKYFVLANDSFSHLWVRAAFVAQ